MTDKLPLLYGIASFGFITIYNFVEGRKDGYYKSAMESSILFLVSLIAYLGIVQLYLADLVLLSAFFIYMVRDIFAVKKRLSERRLNK